jgi:hypothetical protein
MGRMKELFMEYQQQMTGSNAEFIDDEYHFQKWVEEQRLELKDWIDSLPLVSDPSHITHSIFPSNLFYDDEYYKSTYHPTKEEEDEAFKLFNKE